MVTGQRYAAADHHDLGIEDVQEVGDARAQKLGGVVHYFEGQVIAIVGCLVDGLRGDLAEIPADVRRQSAHRTRGNLLDGAQGDVGPGRIGLETPIVAAFAATAFGVDGRMADLAGAVRCSVVELPVYDDPAADPGADGNADGVAAAPRRTHPPLAEHGAVGIVVENR